MVWEQREPSFVASRRRSGACSVTAMALVVVFVVVGLLVLLPMTASTGATAREISLVTRGMAFYLEGDPAPNPTIRLAAGEEVRLTLLNLDRGFKHNLAIDGWNIETVSLDANESTVVRIQAPDQAGRQPYICSPHSEMMHGVIEIVSIN